MNALKISFVVLALLLACDLEPQSGLDPTPNAYSLMALDFRSETPELHRQYWLSLVQAQDPTWAAALDHCRGQQPIRPNCRTVLRVQDTLQVPGFEEKEATP